MKNYTIIIPAYKPPIILHDVVKDLYNKIDNLNLILVNDGSGNEYDIIFEEIKTNYPNVVVLNHPENRGQGAAVKTGFKYVIENNIDSLGVATFDADGQHLAKDVKNLFLELEKNQENTDIVIGSRDFSKENVPFKSRLGNIATQKVFAFLNKSKVNDTQSGLRVIKVSVLNKLINIKSDRMNFAVDFLTTSIENSLRISEFPIETVYIDENKGTHYRVFSDTISTITVLFRHTINSLLSAVIDYVIFAILFFFSNKIFISMLISRIVTAFFNFSVGRKFVFKSTKNFLKEIFKYIILLFSIMFLSYYGVLLGNKIFNTSPYITKPIVETIIFIISFLIQRFIIFKAKED